MRTAIMFASLLTACEPIESRPGSMPPVAPPPAPVVEPPVVAEEQAEAARAEAPPVPPAGVPVDNPAVKPVDERPMTDDELLAAAMGLPLPPTQAPAPVAVEAAPPAAPDVSTRVSWGVRLVSIVADAQPPRAILGLGDGREVVVEPGSFVAEEQVVVMAIGAEGVQIAHVEPSGDRAKIRSEVLTPLYRPAPAPR